MDLTIYMYIQILLLQKETQKFNSSFLACNQWDHWGAKWGQKHDILGQIEI